MVRYYADSEEKYLKSVLLYAITHEVDEESITRAYYDSEGNEPVYNDDMSWEDMFIKGLITFQVIDATGETPISAGLLKPAGYGMEADTGIFILVGDGAPMVSLFSKENEEPGS